jgi:polysaccharide export outer membrane protein
MIFTVLATRGWAQTASPSYRLGQDDRISVLVQNHPEFSGDFLLPADGAIDLPVAGRIAASGKTLMELTEIITTRLRATLRDPQVHVNLKEQRVQCIFVLGNVAKPGAYDLKPEWRITEALAIAGGSSAPPADCRVMLLRRKERTRFEMTAVLRNDPNANPALLPGDVLTIERIELLPVYVTGAVKAPGVYEVRTGCSVVEAIAQAGGLTLPERDVHIAVIRDGKPAVDPCASETSHAATALLRGDVVKVDSVYDLPVTISGKVKTPGPYILKTGDRLLNALAAAGGVADNAATSRLTIVHRDGATATVNLAQSLQQGNVQQNQLLMAGDLIIVPEAVARVAVLGYVNSPGFFSLPDGQTVRVTDALGLAHGIENQRGGIRKVALLRTVNGKQQRITCDLEKFFATADLAQNPEVHPDDIIYVPQNSKPNWDMIFRALSTVSLVYGQILN